MFLRLPRSGTALLCSALLSVSGLHAVPASAADPLTMFLLGFAKNLIESSIEASAQKPPPPVLAPAPIAKAPANVTAGDLRALIDDSFVYLSQPQRAELLAGLEKALDDPANRAQREAILTQFVSVAREVSFVHRQLDRLSDADKRRVAQQFAVNYRALPPQQQQDLLQQLKLRALPLPSDLNEMMLAALAPPS